MAKQKVITFIRRKKADGFSEAPTYIGAKQRFVTAIRNSNLNNLEEQLLLGTDCVTETTYTGSVTTEEKSFYTDKNKPYYKLITKTIQGGILEEREIYAEREILHLKKDDTLFIIGDGGGTYSDRESIYEINNELFDYNEGEEKLIIYPQNFITIKTEELFFVKDNGQTQISVITKKTGQKLVDNGNKFILRETMQNHLKGE